MKFPEKRVKESAKNWKIFYGYGGKYGKRGEISQLMKENIPCEPDTQLALHFCNIMQIVEHIRV